MYLIYLLFLDIYIVSFFSPMISNAMMYSTRAKYLGTIGDHIFRPNFLKWSQWFAYKLVPGTGIEVR